MYESSAGKNTRALTVFSGPYIKLTFQDGPLAEHGENGTTNEEIIRLLIERLDSLDLAFPHEQSVQYNARARESLQHALAELEARTKSRVARGVEGTNEP